LEDLLHSSSISAAPAYNPSLAKNSLLALSIKSWHLEN
jgi:hypothetical protein